ncbi:hypothetical protein [uncultured Tateyamaria sp.]|uniref:hypothetical protein n=1 Tax=uncultured Tateyamaria sp. TaxID=455651 RepID=UPI0034565D06
MCAGFGVGYLALRAGHALTYALGISPIRSRFWIGGIIATVVTGWPQIRALFWLTGQRATGPGRNLDRPRPIR